jgi:hypothetical protein
VTPGGQDTDDTSIRVLRSKQLNPALVQSEEGNVHGSLEQLPHLDSGTLGASGSRDSPELSLGATEGMLHPSWFPLSSGSEVLIG